jgi:hypothetical protein
LTNVRSEIRRRQDSCGLDKFCHGEASGAQSYQMPGWEERAFDPIQSFGRVL